MRQHAPLARWTLACLLAGGLSSSACASSGASSRPTAFPGAPPPATRATDGIEGDTAVREAVVHTALSLVGTPYRFGGASPSAGFDCSGLVQYAFAQHQVAVPRTTAEQYTGGWPVAPDQLRTGDLVFFSTIGPGATHVGIVLEAAGAEFIHAPISGGVVRVERFDSQYWRVRFVGARRLF